MIRILEDYMNENNLSEEDVIRTLENLDRSYVDKNDFYFEIEGHIAYIETIEKAQKMRIREIDLDKGYIELESFGGKNNAQIGKS